MLLPPASGGHHGLWSPKYSFVPLERGYSEPTWFALHANLTECRLETGLGALSGLGGKEGCDQLVMSAPGERGLRGKTELMFVEALGEQGGYCVLHWASGAYDSAWHNANNPCGCMFWVNHTRFEFHSPLISCVIWASHVNSVPQCPHL